MRAGLVQTLEERGFRCKELVLDTWDEQYERYMYAFVLETETGDTGPWEDHMAIQVAGMREYPSHGAGSDLFINIDPMGEE